MAPKFQPPPEPLVERNPFRLIGQDASCPTPPPFADIRPRLPVPILPEDPAWEHLYWSAWESLWSCLSPPTPGSRLIGPFVRPAAETGIEMGFTAFAAQLSGYVPRCYGAD